MDEDYEEKMRQALKIKAMYEGISAYMADTYPEATTREVMAALTAVIVATMQLLDSESRVLLSTAITNSLILGQHFKEAKDE